MIWLLELGQPNFIHSIQDVTSRYITELTKVELSERIVLSGRNLKCEFGTHMNNSFRR